MRCIADDADIEDAAVGGKQCLLVGSGILKKKKRIPRSDCRF